MGPSEELRQLGYLLVGIADLGDKYHALCALHAGEPGRTLARRDAMRDIASRFPAALREFDQTSRDEITDRARQVDEVTLAWLSETKSSQALRNLDQPSLRWMRAALLLHSYLREVLRVKRWLAGRVMGDALLVDFHKWHSEVGDSRWPKEHWTSVRLNAIAKPERGRVTDLVYREIAEQVGMDEMSLRRLLFPQIDGEETE